MARKSAPHFAPLQRVVAEPITDAEQAAIDQLRRRHRGEKEAIVGHEVGAPPTKGAARVLRLCRQLSAKERLALLTQLTSQLSPDGHLELLERLLSQLPPKTLKSLEEEIGPRLRQRTT